MCSKASTETPHYVECYTVIRRTVGYFLELRPEAHLVTAEQDFLLTHPTVSNVFEGKYRDTPLCRVFLRVSTETPHYVECS